MVSAVHKVALVGQGAVLDVGGGAYVPAARCPVDDFIHRGLACERFVPRVAVRDAVSCLFVELDCHFDVEGAVGATFNARN